MGSADLQEITSDMREQVIDDLSTSLCLRNLLQISADTHGVQAAVVEAVDLETYLFRGLVAWCEKRAWTTK